MAKSPTPPLSKAVLDAHVAACQRKERMYEDPTTGLYVMTSFFLASKERCCGSGCRHCPFDRAAQQAANRPDVPAWPYPERSERSR